MEKQELKGFAYEQDNYSEVREVISNLMSDAHKVRKEVSKLNDSIEIVYERYSEQIKTAVIDLEQVVILLGDIYGYLLADDVLENRMND